MLGGAQPVVVHEQIPQCRLQVSPGAWNHERCRETMQCLEAETLCVLSIYHDLSMKCINTCIYFMLVLYVYIYIHYISRG